MGITQQLLDAQKAEREARRKLETAKPEELPSEPCIHRGVESGPAPWQCCQRDIPTFLCDCAVVAADRCVPRAVGKEADAARELGIAVCDGCPHHNSGLKSAAEIRVCYDADKHGYGDAMIAAWIAEGTRGTDDELWIKATGSRGRLLRLFGQNVTPYPTANMVDYVHEYSTELRLREHGSRVRLRAVTMGIKHPPKRPRVRELHPAICKTAEDIIGDSRTVLMFPHAKNGSRVWPAMYWKWLDEILRARGFRTVFLMENNDPALADRPIVRKGLEWAIVVALMQRAVLSIGLDSGPAHVAGTLGVPFLALVGPTIHGGGFDHVPSVQFASVPQAAVPCVGCYWLNELGYVPHICQIGCKALYSLTPDMVAQRVEESLC